MEADLQKRRTVRIVAIAGAVILVAAGLYFLSGRNRSPGQPGAPGTFSSSQQASSNQGPLTVGLAPEPWQYDTTGSRHWDPGHRHWHDGPPPPQQESGGLNTTAPAGNTNPNIPNPQPWQYDPTTNQYFDPNHGHWHTGQPPSPDQRTSQAPQGLPTAITGANSNPAIPNPQPWQYDPTTNKYFDPNHGHWHTGKPPQTP